MVPHVVLGPPPRYTMWFSAIRCDVRLAIHRELNTNSGLTVSWCIMAYRISILFGWWEVLEGTRRNAVRRQDNKMSRYVREMMNRPQKFKALTRVYPGQPSSRTCSFSASWRSIVSPGARFLTPWRPAISGLVVVWRYQRFKGNYNFPSDFSRLCKKSQGGTYHDATQNADQ